MPATQAKLGKGAILRVGNGGSPETFTAVPEVVDISGTPGGKPDEVSVFNHDSPTMWDEILTAIIRGQEVTVTANWQKAGDSANSVTLGLKTTMEAGTAKNLQIVVPTTTPATITFPAFITSWQQTLPKDNAMQVIFSFKNTGPDTRT